MSKVVSIRENGVQKEFTTSKIKTYLQDGTYTYWVPEDEIDLIDKTITVNGEYVAANEGHDGYRTVTVNVEPDVVQKNIIHNGTYTAEDEGHDGYSVVVVNVEGGSGGGQVLSGSDEPTNDLGEDGYVYLQRDTDGSKETPDWVTALGYTYVENLAVREQGAYLNIGRLLPAYDPENPELVYELNIVSDFSYDTLPLGDGIFGAIDSSHPCGIYVGSPTLVRGDFIANLEGHTERILADSTNNHSTTGDDYYMHLGYNDGGHGIYAQQVIFEFYPPSADALEQDMLLFSATGKTPTASMVLYAFDGYIKPSIYSIEHTAYINLVPARRNSDGELGLFDTINSTAESAVFYSNASDTGRFMVQTDEDDPDGEIIAVYYKRNGVWVELLAGGSTLPDAGGHYFGTVSSDSTDTSESNSGSTSESDSSQTSESDSDSSSTSTSDDAQESILDGSGTGSDDTSASETGSNTSGEEEYEESIVDDGV